MSQPSNGKSSVMTLSLLLAGGGLAVTLGTGSFVIWIPILAAIVVGGGAVMSINRW